jgi:hypothetical protein
MNSKQDSGQLHMLDSRGVPIIKIPDLWKYFVPVAIWFTVVGRRKCGRKRNRELFFRLLQLMPVRIFCICATVAEIDGVCAEYDEAFSPDLIGGWFERAVNMPLRRNQPALPKPRAQLGNARSLLLDPMSE